MERPPQNLSGCEKDENGNIVDPITAEIIPRERIIVIKIRNTTYCYDIDALFRFNRGKLKFLDPYTRTPLDEDTSRRIREYAESIRRSVVFVRQDNQQRTVVRTVLGESLGDIIIDLFRMNSPNFGGFVNMFRWNFYMNSSTERIDLYSLNLDTPINRLLLGQPSLLILGSRRTSVSRNAIEKWSEFNRGKQYDWLQDLIQDVQREAGIDLQQENTLTVNYRTQSANLNRVVRRDLTVGDAIIALLSENTGDFGSPNRILNWNIELIANDIPTNVFEYDLLNARLQDLIDPDVNLIQMRLTRLPGPTQQIIANWRNFTQQRNIPWLNPILQQARATVLDPSQEQIEIQIVTDSENETFFATPTDRVGDVLIRFLRMNLPFAPLRRIYTYNFYLERSNGQNILVGTAGLTLNTPLSSLNSRFLQFSLDEETDEQPDIQLNWQVFLTNNGPQGGAFLNEIQQAMLSNRDIRFEFANGDLSQSFPMNTSLGQAILTVFTNYIDINNFTAYTIFQTIDEDERDFTLENLNAPISQITPQEPLNIVIQPVAEVDPNNSALWIQYARQHNNQELLSVLTSVPFTIQQTYQQINELIQNSNSSDELFFRLIPYMPLVRLNIDTSRQLFQQISTKYPNSESKLLIGHLLFSHVMTPYFLNPSDSIERYYYQQNAQAEPTYLVAEPYRTRILELLQSDE